MIEVEKMCKEQDYILIPTSFDDMSRRRARLLAEFFELFELRTLLGENFGGGLISAGVRERIEKSFFVVAILSREVELSDGTWRASEWVIQEISWARALKKDLLILVEEGVTFTNGILGDVERLTFNADRFSDVLIPLGRQMRALLNRHFMTTGIKRLPIHTHVSDEPLRNECGEEATLLVLEIRHLAKQQRYEEALELAVKATRIEPKCWRAWTSLGALLVKVGKVDQGDDIFARVLKDFSDDHRGIATAIHNRAWVQEIKCGLNPSESALREQTEMYERALKLDESRVNTRVCLIICRLLLEEIDEAERLIKDSILHEGFLDALRFELDVRGARVHKALQALPARLRHLMYPDRVIASSGCDY